MTDQQQPLNLSNEEVMAIYMKDPQNKELHLKMAHLLQQTFKGKWFSVRDINSKTAVKSSQEATRMIIGLQLFGLCTSQQQGKVVKFKIILTPEEKIEVLIKHKNNHLKQIELLDIEIEKIIKESSK